MQLLRYRVKYHRISHIFISHLHGDHYFGLMGLLSTFHLQGRTKELHLFGQQELMDVLELQLRLSNTTLRYNLIFHAVRHYSAEVIMEDDDVQIRSIVLNHRVPCTGFLFREKAKPRKLIVQKLQHYNIPFSSYAAIKNGEDYIDDFGKKISNKELSKILRNPVVMLIAPILFMMRILWLMCEMWISCIMKLLSDMICLNGHRLLITQQQNKLHK